MGASLQRREGVDGRSVSMELRHEDFSLDDEQEALQSVFRSFLGDHSPPDLVRASEPLGFDADLWRALQDLRPVAMGLPVTVDGDGAGLVELAIVAEEFGRRAAPVPFVEAVVAARAVAVVDPESALLPALADGTAIASLAIGPVVDERTLVPAGAVADFVVALRADELVGLSVPAPAAHVPNLASAPLAWHAVGGGDVLARGADAAAAFARASTEWRVLTAALLVGFGQAALDLGVQYARDRDAFGVAIGSFQAVAHPLVDALIALESARRLTYKSAWFGEHEPENLGALATMAFVAAAEASERAGAVAVHTQGGFGFMLESDVQLFYRRAKGGALLPGDRKAELRRLADELYGPVANGAR